MHARSLGALRPHQRPIQKLAAFSGFVPTNALVAAERSTFVDWPETGLWEVKGEVLSVLSANQKLGTGLVGDVKSPLHSKPLPQAGRGR
jgi:hypothetical protein